MPTYIVLVNAANGIEIRGNQGGNIRRDGTDEVDVEWRLNSANPGHTLKIVFEELALIGKPGKVPLSPFDSGNTVLSGATAYTETLKALAKGAKPLCCKYTVDVVGSGAATLDPVIIVEP